MYFFFVNRSRKAPTSPTNGFSSGPLRSASCAVMSAVVDNKPKETPKIDRESFKRSHSVSESISRVDESKYYVNVSVHIINYRHICMCIYVLCTVFI